MANRLLSFLRSAAAVIRNETAPSANTHIRVGGFLQDLTDSSIQKWDPSAAYSVGQIVLFNGNPAECEIATTAGQSPATHKAKWNSNILLSADQIALGSTKPVSGNALAEKLLQNPPGSYTLPAATEYQVGGARVATQEEVDEGVLDNVFVSAKKQKTFFSKFFEGFVVPTLNFVLANGHIGEDDIVLRDVGGKLVQFILQRGSVAAFKGLVVANPDGSASGSVGFDELNKFRVIRSGNNVLTASEQETILQTLMLNMYSGEAGFQRINTNTLQIADEYQYVSVPVPNPARGTYDFKAVPRGVAARQSLRDMDGAEMAAKISPFLTSKTVDGDTRLVESPIYCFTEVAQLNQQYIPITFSMLGTPQPHSLNAPGTAIWRALQAVSPSDADLRADASADIKITFPDNNHYLLTLINPALTEFSGELALVRKTPGTLVTGGGTRYVVSVTRLLTELPAAVSLGHPTGKKLFLVPQGLTPPAVGSLVTPLGSGWQAYTGLFSALGTSCADVPPPAQAGDPTWVTTISPAPGAITKGTYYTWSFSMSENTDPGGAGLTVVVKADALLDFLHADYPDADTFRLSGTMPTSFFGSSLIIPLTAQQSDGRYAYKYATITIANPSTTNPPPTWKTYNWPSIKPGQFYSVAVKVSDLVDPGADGLRMDITYKPPQHPWLNFANGNGEQQGMVLLYGTAPLSVANPLLYALTAVQSDYQRVDNVISIPVAEPVALSLALQQLVSSTGTRTMILRGGGDFGTGSATNPYETTSGPSGFLSRGRQLMRRWGTNVLNTEYTYDNDPGYTNAPQGTYNGVYEAPDGRKKYFTYVLTGGTMNQALTLSDTPPEVAVIPIEIVNVDYSYQHNSPPGIPTNLYVYVKTNGGTGTLSMAYEVIEPAPGFVVAKTGYSAFTLGDYGPGYTYRISVLALIPGVQPRIYVKASTGQEVILTLPYLPVSGDVNRTTILPAPSAPTFTILNVYESFSNSGPVVTKPANFTFLHQGEAFNSPLPFYGTPPQFTDPDGDPMTYELQYSSDDLNYSTVLPSWMSSNGTSYYGTPPLTGAPGSSYTLKMLVLARDSRGGIAIDKFNLIVFNPTPAP